MLITIVFPTLGEVLTCDRGLYYLNRKSFSGNFNTVSPIFYRFERFISILLQNEELTEWTKMLKKKKGAAEDLSCRATVVWLIEPSAVG